MPYPLIFMLGFSKKTLKTCIYPLTFKACNIIIKTHKSGELVNLRVDLWFFVVKNCVSASFVIF